MRYFIRKHSPVFLFYFSYYGFIAFVLHLFFNFSSREGIFILEKGIIALHGAPPHLENIGLVYPPVPFLGALIFAWFKVVWGPQLLSALGSAILATLALSEVKRLGHGKTVYYLFAAVFLIHPLVLFSATLGRTAVLFALLLFFYIYMIIRFSYLGTVFNLFVAGLTIGLMTFVRYETIFILLFMTPVIHIVTGGLKFRTKGAVLSLFLINLTTPVFAFLSWAYLNWLFTGDWLNFLHSPYAYFRNIELQGLYNLDSLQARYNVLQSFWSVFSKAALVFSPFFFSVYRIGNFSIVWFALAPLFAIVFAAFAGLTQFALDEFLVLIPLAGLLRAFEFREMTIRHKRVFYGLIVFSIPLSLYLFVNSSFREEREFGRLFLGEKPKPMLEAERKLAKYIEINVPEGKRILLDDANGYPIIAYSGDPDRFLLPYQYAFRSAVISPISFVDGFIVADPRSPEGKVDLLNQFHPRIFLDGFPGAYLAKELEPWRFYLFKDSERSDSENKPEVSEKQLNQ